MFTKQKDTTFVNIYVPDIGGPKYKKWVLTEIKVEIDSNKIIARELITPYTSMDRLQTEINKDTLDKMDVPDIHRKFHPKAAGHTFLPSACGTFSR